MSADDGNKLRLSDLLKEHEELKASASELEKQAKDLRRKQDSVRYGIMDYLQFVGMSSVTDDETRHRATVYNEEKWVVADALEFEAAVRESAYLRSCLIIEAVDHKTAVIMAQEEPDLFREIPGMMLVSTPKLRITPKKGD
jgi:hypothetical protein